MHENLSSRQRGAHPPRAVIWASIASTRTLDDGFLLFAIIIVVIASRVPVLQFLITIGGGAEERASGRGREDK